MPSVYRALVVPPPRCPAHPEQEATATCTRCRARICDACSIPAQSGVCCPGCVRRARRLRSLSRACLAFAATVAGAVATLTIVPDAEAPLGEAALQAAANRCAVRNCDEPRALLLLMEAFANSDDRALRTLGRDFDASCGDRPMVLAMEYRSACQTGDAPAASALAARLTALGPEVRPSWQPIACPPLRAAAPRSACPR